MDVPVPLVMLTITCKYDGTPIEEEVEWVEGELVTLTCPTCDQTYAVTLERRRPQLRVVK
jgi:uncharacterized Zn finger protein (UPF0148 family)